MAYTPKQWVCGETITAEGLNNIEEGIQDALECCEDKGFECTITEVTVLDDTVESTIFDNGGYKSDIVISASDITADSINVVFNGIEYAVNREVYYDYYVCYGAPYRGGFGDDAFATYPFSVYSSGTDGFKIGVPQSSTNTVKITTVDASIETSECFDEAVKKNMLKNIKDYGTTGIVEGGVSSNVASGDASHAEGSGTTASGNASHAEGDNTTASGIASHAGGTNTTASGNNSRAEGLWTEASGRCSHAQGEQTIAQGLCQTVIGKYNVAQGSANAANSTDYALIIGNGTGGAQGVRSNALAIKWDGTFVFANGTEITPAQFASLLALL